jgi:tyrosyl-tRNA synthetase
VHGKEEAEKAEAAAKALFGAGAGEDAPTTELSADDLVDGAIDVLTLLAKSGLVASKSEARRTVEQGGASADGEKITDIRYTFTAEQLAAGVLLKRGKKNYRRVILK